MSVNHQKQLLSIYRRNIRHYRRQMDMLRSGTPIGVINSVIECRSEINRIKGIIINHYNESVDDSDEDTVNELEISLGVE